MSKIKKLWKEWTTVIVLILLCEMLSGALGFVSAFWLSYKIRCNLYEADDHLTRRLMARRGRELQLLAITIKSMSTNTLLKPLAPERGSWEEFEILREKQLKVLERLPSP